MKHDHINYTVVGLFVLSMLVALLLMLLQLTGKTGESDTYHVTYQQVTGLKFGTPVYYEGYHIGQVERISPRQHNGSTRFRIDISVQRDWQIPEDSHATQIASGLLSAISINILGGQSKAMLLPGNEIQGREATSLFAAVNEVASEIKSLSDDTIRPLLANANQRIDNISDQIEAFLPVFFNNLQALTKRMLNSADAIDSALKNENLAYIDKSLQDLSATAADFRLLASRLQDSQRNFDHVIGNARSMTKNANTVVKNVDRVVASSQQLINENRPDIRATTRELHRSLTQLSGKMDSILYNLDSASRNLKEFTRTVRDDPSSLLSSSRSRDPVVPRR